MRRLLDPWCKSKNVFHWKENHLAFWQIDVRILHQYKLCEIIQPARQQHPPTHPLSLCQTHSPSQHSKNQLCWNEFNPQVSTVTPPHAHLRAPGGAEAWLMTWPLHGPRMTSSWGSRHLARRNSQRDVKVLPSEAHRGLRGVPLHSMLHSLSWSTRRNCRGVKKWGDKQRKHFLNQTFFFWEWRSSAPKHFNIHENRCDSGGIYEDEWWRLCGGQNRLLHQKVSHRTGVHKNAIQLFKSVSKVLS